MKDLASCESYFFFNDTATTDIYTLSLHDALPISHLALAGDAGAVQPAHRARLARPRHRAAAVGADRSGRGRRAVGHHRSEEHTSELQSRQYLVCRLLLEKKKLLLLDALLFTSMLY